MSHRGKKYVSLKETLSTSLYNLEDAVKMLATLNPTKFDASCEVHFNLKLDPKQADQNIRTSISLPNGTGKDVRVVAFVAEDKVKEAKAAGATFAGTEELVEKIDGGWVDFDVAIATPDQMKALGKIAKILGQKRLMPNPKVGTVTPDFVKAIKELKQGKIELRIDKDANLHLIFGKVSFETQKLSDNLKAIVKALLDIKPASVKGNYINTVTLCTTMGPGVHVDVNDAMNFAK